MNLVLYGDGPLEEQFKLAESIFSKIPNREVRKRNNHQKPLDSHAGRILIFKNELPRITILWQSPALKQMSREKPERFIKYLLRHSGKGSLAYFLKEHGLSMSLEINSQAYRDYLTYLLQLKLPQEDVKKTSEIISVVYRYISKLRNMSPTQYSSYWIEYLEMKKLSFKFSRPRESVL